MKISDQLASADGRPSGFDYLRLILSVSVIAWHGLLVCYGRPAEDWFWTGPLRPLVFAILPAFFALSGFLVASSLERNAIPEFLTLRFIRIFPALVVEVVLSALILGPILTTVPWSQYFFHPDFAAYFLNVLGMIHYNLPGVFENLPSGRAVNAQLWTVPFELECYIAIVVLALVGLVSRPRIFLAFAVALACGVMVYKGTFGTVDPLNARAPGRLLVLCFLFGVSLYLLRARIPFHFVLFMGAVAGAWVFFSFVETMYLGALPMAYVTVYLGLLNPDRSTIIRGADYSYGVYLYGFPFQQLLSHAFPSFRVWWFNVAGSLLLAGLFAALSWHFVERPVLLRKRWFVDRVRRLVPRAWENRLSIHRTKGAEAVGRTFAARSATAENGQPASIS